MELLAPFPFQGKVLLKRGFFLLRLFVVVVVARIAKRFSKRERSISVCWSMWLMFAGKTQHTGVEIESWRFPPSSELSVTSKNCSGSTGNREWGPTLRLCQPLQADNSYTAAFLCRSWQKNK